MPEEETGEGTDEPKGDALQEKGDLDAAFAGAFSNREAVKQILKAVSIPVQLGGGVRNMADIKERLELGVARVILGTAAFEEPELVAEAAVKYPGRIVAGIDAKDGRVATRGWAQNTKVSPVLLAQEMKTRGIQTVVYTDIARDGMQTGIEREAYERMAEAFGHPVIASGGVASMADIERLAPVAASIEGIITGRAIYEGTLPLREAIEACRNA